MQNNTIVLNFTDCFTPDLVLHNTLTDQNQLVIQTFYPYKVGELKIYNCDVIIVGFTADWFLLDTKFYRLTQLQAQTPSFLNNLKVTYSLLLITCKTGVEKFFS